MIPLPAASSLIFTLHLPTRNFLPALITTTLTIPLVSITLQATRHKEMILPMLLPPLNRPQAQNPQGAFMHDSDPSAKEPPVPVLTTLQVMGSPHILISMAHLMQQRTDHALKGVFSPSRPTLFENQARIQLDAALSLFFAPARGAIADTPCAAWDENVRAPLDGDIVVKAAGKEDEVEVGEGLDGEVGSRDKAFLDSGSGEKESLDGGFFGSGDRPFDVILPHYFFGGFSACYEGALVGGWENVLLVEINLGLAIGVGRAGGSVEGL